MDEPVRNLLPGLSIGARRTVLDSLVAKLPTSDITAKIEALYGEVVSDEVIDRARLLCIGKIEKYLAERDEVTLQLAINPSVINQSPIMAALEKQAMLCFQVSNALADEMAEIRADADPEKKAKALAVLQIKQHSLAATSGQIVRAQILAAKAAIELPHLHSQIHGKKEAPRSEITSEFMRQIEGMLGILPYNPDFEPEVIDATTTTI